MICRLEDLLESIWLTRNENVGTWSSKDRADCERHHSPLAIHPHVCVCVCPISCFLFRLSPIHSLASDIIVRRERKIWMLMMKIHKKVLFLAMEENCFFSYGEWERTTINYFYFIFLLSPYVCPCEGRSGALDGFSFSDSEHLTKCCPMQIFN